MCGAVTSNAWGGLAVLVRQGIVRGSCLGAVMDGTLTKAVLAGRSMVFEAWAVSGYSRVSVIW